MRLQITIISLQLRISRMSGECVLEIVIDYNDTAS